MNVVKKLYNQSPDKIQSCSIGLCSDIKKHSLYLLSGEKLIVNLLKLRHGFSVLELHFRPKSILYFIQHE